MSVVAGLEPTSSVRARSRSYSKHSVNDASSCPIRRKATITFDAASDSDASVRGSFLGQRFSLLGARRSQISGRITNAARFPHASVVECSFYQFVTQQRDDASTYKQGAGVAIPVHTGGATPIIRRPLWLRRELSHLLEMQRVVPEEEYRGRVFEKMAITGAGRRADRQTERTRMSRIWLIKKPLAAELTLRRPFAYVFVDYFRHIAEAHGREVQVPSVSTHDYRVWTHFFDSVNSVGERKLAHGAASPAQCKEACLLRRLRVAPAAARAVKKIIPDKPVLKSVALRFGQSAITGTRNRLAAVGEACQRYPHQRHITSRDLGAPHAVASGIRAQQHVEVTILALQEGELIYRAARNAQRGWGRAIQWQAIDHGLCTHLPAMAHPIVDPHVHRFR